MLWKLEDYLPQGRYYMGRHMVLQRQRFSAAVGVTAFLQELVC